MYSIIHKLQVTFTDVEYLLSPAYEHPRRARLFFDYLRLRIKASLNRWFHFTHEHFLSFKVMVPDYETFFVIFRQIFVRHTYYLNTQSATPNIIDCGGNIGMSVLYWKYLYPHAHVTVFEPSKEVLGILQQNIERNALSNVRVVPAAVSAQEGEARIHTRGSAACGNTLQEGLVDTTSNKTSTESYTVKTVRLSSYITERVDILKLDIEGNEGVVLKELASTDKLSNIQECVLEYHYYPKIQGNNLAHLLGVFNEKGFETQFYFEENDSTQQLSLIKNGSYAVSIRATRKEHLPL